MQIAQTKRKAYQDEDYWGKPVPDFGVAPAALLVVGLAPGAHGANRTGRMFTGDRSGEWLYRALHQYEFANQPNSEDRSDGLQLIGTAITNVCRCAPPQNRPTGEEIANCHPFLRETFQLCQPRVVLALGSIAWNATIKMLVELEWMNQPKRRPKFGHGEVVAMDDLWLLGSYHPSQQNTFTGRLTRRMLNSVFRKARKLIDQAEKQTDLN